MVDFRTWDDFPPITCRDILTVMMLECWMLDFNSPNSSSHLKITFNCEFVWGRCISGMEYQTTQVIIIQAMPSGLVVVAQIIQHFVKIDKKLLKYIYLLVFDYIKIGWKWSPCERTVIIQLIIELTFLLQQTCPGGGGTHDIFGWGCAK